MTIIYEMPTSYIYMTGTADQIISRIDGREETGPSVQARP